MSFYVSFVLRITEEAGKEEAIHHLESLHSEREDKVLSQEDMKPFNIAERGKRNVPSFEHMLLHTTSLRYCA
jgi:hypothetical protein